MPTEALPSPMSRALRSANLPLAASLAARHPHSDIITRPVTDTGLTPLHLATILRDTHLISVLLSSGARPDTQALLLAAQSRSPENLSLLIAESSSEVLRASDEAVHAAAWAGCADCVKVLVEGGVGVEWTAGDGATALCCAVMAGDQDMVESLLKGGAGVVGVRTCGVSVEEWARRIGGRVEDLVIEVAERQREDGCTEKELV